MSAARPRARAMQPRPVTVVKTGGATRGRVTAGTVLTLALLTLALFGSWWLSQPGLEGDAMPPSAGQENAPEFYVTDLKATTMTPDGKPARTLSTSHMRQLPQEQATEIRAPRFTVHQQQGAPWQIRADSGRVIEDGSLILLQGEVVIDRAASADNRPMRLHTRNLRVRPAQDYAETDEAVRVSSDESQIEAIGLQAWLGEPPRLKFLSQVRGHYVPR